MKYFIKTVSLLLAIIPFTWALFYLVIPADSLALGFQLLALGISGLMALVFYIVHIVQNSHLSANGKSTWVLLMLLFGSITQMAYWIVWVRKQ